MYCKGFMSAVQCVHLWPEMDLLTIRANSGGNAQFGEERGRGRRWSVFSVTFHLPS